MGTAARQTGDSTDNEHVVLTSAAWGVTMIVEPAYAHLFSYDEETWPWSVPCVRQLLNEGLRFTAPVAFLVGENDSGKSPLVETLAEGPKAQLVEQSAPSETPHGKSVATQSRTTPT